MNEIELYKVKKTILTFGLGVVIGSSTVGCGKNEITFENPKSAVEHLTNNEYSDIVSETVYSDEFVSILTVDGLESISVYVKALSDVNYSDEFYSSLNQTLLNGKYKKIELSNLDSNFDLSKIDLNGFEVIHLNYCKDDFDYSLLSDYHFKRVYINEYSNDKNRVSEVLPCISSDFVSMSFDYTGKSLDNYNLKVALNENVTDLDLRINNDLETFNLENIEICSNRWLNISLSSNLYCGNVTENTSFILPDACNFSLYNVCINDTKGLEGLKNCSYFQYFNEDGLQIEYNETDDWNDIVLSPIKKFNDEKQLTK